MNCLLGKIIGGCLWWILYGTSKYIMHVIYGILLYRLSLYVLGQSLDKDNMDGHDIPLIKFNVWSSYVKYFGFKWLYESDLGISLITHLACLLYELGS